MFHILRFYGSMRGMRSDDERALVPLERFSLEDWKVVKEANLSLPVSIPYLARRPQRERSVPYRTCCSCVAAGKKTTTVNHSCFSKLVMTTPIPALGPLLEHSYSWLISVVKHSMSIPSFCRQTQFDIIYETFDAMGYIWTVGDREQSPLTVHRWLC